MHHSNKFTEIEVIDTPKGTIMISFKKGFPSMLDVELSPREAEELIADIKSSLNELSLEILRIIKRV